jgi:hypothetical protein
VQRSSFFAAIKGQRDDRRRHYSFANLDCELIAWFKIGGAEELRGTLPKLPTKLRELDQRVQAVQSRFNEARVNDADF